MLPVLKLCLLQRNNRELVYRDENLAEMLTTNRTAMYFQMYSEINATNIRNFEVAKT